MVKVTVELVRKKAEHHEGQLAPLVEISLHQESIEKLEYIQDWCPKLQILLLQSNLISKIENLNKLKELEYLNLALNNVEKIENLERCESLEKLDFTLNFIGELTSVTNLRDNYNLRLLYMTGNPCTDYVGYRDYVVSVLPQLEFLDGEKIRKSERIMALQNFLETEKNIKVQQKVHALKRNDQKIRLKKEYAENITTDGGDMDEEKTKKFWNEKSEHAPEVRLEMDRQTNLRRNPQNKDSEKETNKKERPLFTPDGRPFNINQARLHFIFNDENPQQYELDLDVYKHLDTSLMDVDVQPTYVRVTTKGKIFQLCLPEEVNTSESSAKRSQITGRLLITMPKLNKEIKKTLSFIKLKTKADTKIQDEIKVKNNQQNRREFLEIGPARNILDITNNISAKVKDSFKTPAANNYFPPEKLPPLNFIDNPEVPDLM